MKKNLKKILFATTSTVTLTASVCGQAMATVAAAENPDTGGVQ